MHCSRDSAANNTCSWKIPILYLDVTDSILSVYIKAYSHTIQTNQIESEMTAKILRYSLTATMVAFSLIAFGAVVFG